MLHAGLPMFRIMCGSGLAKVVDIKMIAKTTRYEIRLSHINVVSINSNKIK